MKWFSVFIVLVLSILPRSAFADALVDKSIGIGSGVSLHYVEEGRGRAVIFVHGSLADYGYWENEVPAFATRYHAIAYSRRYNLPNQNAAVDGYSAVTDAEDLAAFIKKLGLHDVDIVGHSYGALTTLILAIRHPELVHKIVLAEPPAVSLLPAAMRDDIQTRMVDPMQRAFRSGDRERGVEAFIDYVFRSPRAWQDMPPSSRVATLADAHEWDVMMTRGTLFPQITAEQVRSVRAPALILTGTKTYPFLRTIDDRLAPLLPNARHVLLTGAGHQMWYQKTLECRRLTEAFFR